MNLFNKPFLIIFSVCILAVISTILIAGNSFELEQAKMPTDSSIETSSKSPHGLEQKPENDTAKSSRKSATLENDDKQVSIYSKRYR
jgi:uncharacterized ion transporter superfamily protein YfcC